MQFYLLKASVFPLMISEEMFLAIWKLVTYVSAIDRWLVCPISKPVPSCRNTNDPIATTTKVPQVRKYVSVRGKILSFH